MPPLAILKHPPHLLKIGLGIFLIYYLLPLTNPNLLPGQPGDVYTYLWQADWFCSNFFPGHFHSLAFFYPHGIDLSGGYVAPLTYSATCLINHTDPRFILKLIYTLQIITLFTINFWVARKSFKNIWLQLSFIFLYSFSGFYLLRINHHIDLISTIWAVGLVYTLAHNFRPLQLKSYLTLALGLSLSFASSWQNIPNLIPLTLILTLPKFHSLSWFLSHLSTLTRRLLLSTLLFLITFLPFSLPIIRHNLHPPQLEPLTHQQTYSTTIASYLIPNNSLESLFTSLATTISRSHSFLEASNPIDLIILTLALYFLYQQHKNHRLKLKHPTTFILITYLLLSFGSKLTFSGTPTIPLPYYSLLSRIPPFNLTRTPGRYGIVPVFLLSLITLQFLDHHLHLIKPRLRSKLPLALTTYSLISTTLIANNFQLPTHSDYSIFPQPTLTTIRQDPTPSILLHLPLMIGVSQSSAYTQVITQKPIINGYISHAIQTTDTLTTLKQDPLLSQLECQDTPYSLTSTPTSTISASTFTQSLHHHHIKYLIVFNPHLHHPSCQRVKTILTPLLANPQLTKPLPESNQLFDIYQILP